MHASEATIECPLDLTATATFRNGPPHDVFTNLRRQAPIFWHPQGSEGGFWGLTRQAEIRAVSRSPELFSSAAKGVFYQAQGALEGSLLTSDPPEHTRLRGFIEPKFSSYAVQKLEPWLQQQAATIVEAALARSECDFVYDLAARLPLLTICELMAVPDADREHLLALGDDVIRAGAPERIARAMTALGDYGLGLAQDRRNGAGEDLVSMMLRSSLSDRPLTDREFAGQFMQVAVAANETTRTLLSGVALLLADDPPLWVELRADPALLPLAVEEFLRWISPIHYMRRTAVSPTEIGGQRIEAGQAVVLYYVSANRDEVVFERPFQLDIRRRPNPHLAFGVGKHACLGSALARLEARVFLTALLQRVASLQIVGEPVRLPSNVTNSWDRIPVRLYA